MFEVMNSACCDDQKGTETALHRFTMSFGRNGGSQGEEVGDLDFIKMSTENILVASV